MYQKYCIQLKLIPKYSMPYYIPSLSYYKYLNDHYELKFNSKHNKAKKIEINKYDGFISSEQRIYWDNLKMSIETAIKKLNPGNIRSTSIKLIKLNIIRGKGLLCRSIMEAQSHSINFTHIYATLVSFINHDFPNVAELLLVRCICLFTNAYKCKEEFKYAPPVLFIAHFVQNNVAKDWLVLEIIQLLIKTPNLQSIGLVDNIMKICGKKLNSNSHNELDLKYTFDKLQNISQDEHIDESVQCLAKTILLTYQNHYEDEQEFDLVDPHKQYTHFLILDENYDPEYELDNFVYDLDFKSTEIMYKTISKKILKLKSKPYYFANYELDEMADDEDECEPVTNMLSLNESIAIPKIISMLVNLNLPPSNIALLLMTIKLEPGQETEFCMEYMVCCFENSVVYNNYFAEIIQSFCQLNPLMIGSLELIFSRVLPIVHLNRPNSLKNIAKLFAQLLFSNSISWNVFSAIRLAETSYCGRTYFKELFKNLILLMGRDALKERILDPSLRNSFAGFFPLNNGLYDYVLCIVFFADIDLYDLIDQFRESLTQGIPV
ncbi:hypothetical protein QTP88_007177 [Uroleucon formosanum]